MLRVWAASWKREVFAISSAWEEVSVAEAWQREHAVLSPFEHHVPASG